MNELTRAGTLTINHFSISELISQEVTSQIVFISTSGI